MIKKKTTLLLILIVFLTSCKRSETPSYNPDTNSENYGELRLRVIDSCEYLENGWESSNRYSLTHKGNCKFCKERNGH